MEKTAQLIFERDSINYHTDNGKPFYMYRMCHCSNCGHTVGFMFDFLDSNDLNKKKLWGNILNMYCDCCGCRFENRTEMINKDVEDMEAQG